MADKMVYGPLKEEETIDLQGEAVSHTTSAWCYNCSDSGHNSNSCRFNSAVECHNCHRLGHKQERCHLYILPRRTW